MDFFTLSIFDEFFKCVCVCMFFFIFFIFFI